MLLFTALSPEELAAWASGPPRDLQGHAATPGFLEAFELASSDSEDADLTLLEIAGVSGLLRHGVRLVAVVEANADGVEPPEFGAVAASAVPWQAVESLFTDDEAGARAAASTAQALQDATLEEAWERPEIQDLLRTTELLWHDASEWQRL